MNEKIFTDIVNEYNRRVNAGMSRSYINKAWRVVLSAYRANQYEPWMRKFTIREAEKLFSKSAEVAPILQSSTLIGK